MELARASLLAPTPSPRPRGLVVLVLLSLLPLAEGNAQDLEPRQYSNIPIGLNFLAAGYAVSQGGVLFDPAVEFDNAKIDIDGPLLGYARSLALGGLSGKVDAGAARVCLSGSADYQGERASRHVCGWTDARMRLTVNFLGAPARRLAEYAGYRQNVVVGASIALGAPTGQYDADRLVNVGTNRWSVKTEIGVSKVVRAWILEAALAGTFYQDNDEFYGGVTREQRPITALQLHAVRNFASGIWFAIDSTHYSGGQTITDGRANRNLQSNARLGVTLSLPINARQSLKLNASTGVSTRTGSDFDTVGMAWQYRWGGALGR
jgi:Putative MetA-pathway of phenol degradation